MGNEWKEVKLEEVVDILGDGLHGTPKYDDKGEYFFINGNNLNGKIEINDKTKKVNKNEYEKYKKELNDRTVFVSINGTLGKVALYNGEKVMLGKSACYFNVKKNTDKQFIKYIMLSNLFKGYIQNYATGTTIKNIGLKQMREFPFKIPPLPTQKKIAEILSSLDDKIELNNQMNETLEEIAQALFKQWFVDFEFPFDFAQGKPNENGEPYKSSGGEMVESELGLIPKGWEVGTLEEIVGFVVDNRGKTPPIIDEAGKKYPLIEVNALTSNSRTIILGNVKKYVDKNTYDKWFRKGHPKKDDVLISTVGSIGEIALVYDEEICIAQNIIAIRGKSSGVFMYQLLQSIVEKIKSLNISSVQPSIKVPHLLSSKIIIPNTEIINYFVEKVTDSSNNIFYNTQQNNNLTQIRDTLLPKLMNGEIDVNEVEI